MGGVSAPAVPQDKCGCFHHTCLCRTTPGYWSNNEAVASPQQCSVPSTDRCIGWSSALSATACGVGYDQASPGCESCAPGYFPQLQQCEPCPHAGSPVMVRVLAYAVVLCSLFVLALVTIVAITRRNGVKLATGIFRYGVIPLQSIGCSAHYSVFANIARALNVKDSVVPVARVISSCRRLLLIAIQGA